MSAFIKQYCSVHGYAPLVPASLTQEEIDALWWSIVDDLGFWG